MKKIDYKLKLKELELLNLDKTLWASRKKRLIKERVDDLKNRPTKSEAFLERLFVEWGFNFIAQFPIETKYSFYIIDFYFPKKRICLEIDGGYHDTDHQLKKDRTRDRFLKKKKFHVLRLTNEKANRMTKSDFLNLLNAEYGKKRNRSTTVHP